MRMGPILYSWACAPAASTASSSADMNARNVIDDSSSAAPAAPHIDDAARLSHNRWPTREECMTAPGKSESVTALRGTVVPCRDDPFLTDPAKACAVETDGIVLCRNGLIESAGAARGSARR